jgi:2-keto-4-pentenoate hydratase/2-oxohepta-3-ene-1,7-dioic acid hydratase in catechol pathway
MREMEQNGILVVPKVWYERPICYHPNRLCVTGTDTDVPWPSYCNALDFELEFGCYIGKAGRDITRDNARNHIAGYTIFNDFSARDEQTREDAGPARSRQGQGFRQRQRDGSSASSPPTRSAIRTGSTWRCA